MDFAVCLSVLEEWFQFKHLTASGVAATGAQSWAAPSVLQGRKFCVHRRVWPVMIRVLPRIEKEKLSVDEKIMSQPSTQ